MTNRDSGLGSSGASELFQLLRDGQPRTRAELARLTGLARSTITLRLEHLLDLGLIAPVEDAQSTGGRPSSQFALNASARVVLAVDIGASHGTLAIADQIGATLTMIEFTMTVDDDIN